MDLNIASSIKVISAKENKSFQLSNVLSYLKWTYQERHLIWLITSVDLKCTMLKTKLSYLWWLLDPLLNFLCYLFLVGVLHGNRSFDIPYPLYVITAILPWHFTAKTLTGSALIWERYKALIGQIRFPYIHLIFSNLLYELTLYLISQIIIFAACFYYGFYPQLTWLYLPFIFLLHSLLILTLMLFSSLISFLFYDYQKLLPFLLRIWFFASPAVWSIDMIPEPYRQLIALNPLTLILIGYRNALLYGKSLNFWQVQVYLIFLILSLSAGLFLFIKKETYINRYV